METSLFTNSELQAGNDSYLVLARKYRPTSFADMVGQDVLVQTFTNAVACNRVAHAFVLTGIRGVGKTTAARIIARALNCVGELGDGAINVNPCGKCEHCVAIAEDRHQDVIEIDAASNTGVADMRELIENTRYRPISGRFKVYIIDEVHMLSNSAFNALLKTLEEPPPHVKFIFATTEIKKIPLTILSRCQRFDLRRVSVEELVAHFSNVLGKEGIAVDDDCLRMIAVAAGGSVRDGLSILDQAISHTQGVLKANVVREMLGLCSSEDLFYLYGHILKGEVAEALGVITKLYSYGGDPLLILQDLMNMTHILAKAKNLPAVLNDVPEFERAQYNQFLGIADIARLNRIWLALFKGFDEMRLSYNTLISLEMVVIRVAHLSNLPAPEELIRKLKARAAEKNSQETSEAVSSTATDGMQVASDAVASKQSFSTLKGIAGVLFDNNEVLLSHYVSSVVHLVSLEPNKMVMRPSAEAPKNFTIQLREALERITHERWAIITSTEAGAPTLTEQVTLAEKERIDAVHKNPTVDKVLNSFTGLEIADIKFKNVV